MTVTVLGLILPPLRLLWAGNPEPAALAFYLSGLFFCCLSERFSAAARLSAPMIGSLTFFLQLGCVTGVAARMAGEVRLAAVRPATVATPETQRGHYA